MWNVFLRFYLLFSWSCCGLVRLVTQLDSGSLVQDWFHPWVVLVMIQKESWILT